MEYENIENFLKTLDMPDWGYIGDIEFDGGAIRIRYCDFAEIKICPKFENEDGLTIEQDCALGYWDLNFVMDVLNNRDRIIGIFNASRRR